MYIHVRLSFRACFGLLGCIASKARKHLVGIYLIDLPHLFPRDESVHPSQTFYTVPTIAIAAYFLAAGLLAVRHARNKRFAEHR